VSYRERQGRNLTAWAPQSDELRCDINRSEPHETQPHRSVEATVLQTPQTTSAERQARPCNRAQPAIHARSRRPERQGQKQCQRRGPEAPEGLRGQRHKGKVRRHDPASPTTSDNLSVTLSCSRVVWAPQGPALSLLRSLADDTVQAGGPGLSRDAFISGVPRELCVALCRGNASLGRSGLYALTRESGLACCAASLAIRLRWTGLVRGCLLDGRLD
jgi:hypothetical protein